MTFNAEKSIDSNAVHPLKADCIALDSVMLSNADKFTVFNFVHPLNVYDQHDALIVFNTGKDALTMLVELAKA